MTFLDTVLPSQASNDFRGGKVPIYGFCLMLLPITFRALVHFLKDDSGVNSIASIHLFHGDPDPNVVVYMFSSLWGSQQAVMLLFYLLVLYRYRNLIPLMFVLMLLEIGFRMVVGSLHPLTEEFYVRTPPGMYSNSILGSLSVAMLYLSHRNITATSEPATTKLAN
jgi:hypothetical protein